MTEPADNVENAADSSADIETSDGASGTAVGAGSNAEVGGSERGRWWEEGRYGSFPMRQIAKIARKLVEVDRENREYMKSEKAAGIDWRVIIVLITVAICLTILEYFGMSNEYERTAGILETLGMDGWAEKLRHAMTRADNVRINKLTYWAAGCITAYFIIPGIVIKFFFRDRLRDYGLQLKGMFEDAWLYVVLFVPVLICVFIVAADPHFLETYPFYDMYPDESLWPYFWRWEFLYCLQFFALEFFFRGFMIHGTRHRLGIYSVLVMMVPYCMIHYGKPMPETLGAIIAGIVLGLLSLKSRSIWMGVAIHASVALSMDFMALCHKGYFAIPLVCSGEPAVMP